MKPTLRDTLNSVLAQTRRDFEAVVIDSGQWIGETGKIPEIMAGIYAEFSGHPLINWVTTGERPGLPAAVCPVAWATNRAIEAGLARGPYLCTFYDDDLYRPPFMEVMAGYLDGHPDDAAVCCAQARMVLQRDGGTRAVGEIRSPLPRRMGQFDCQVDGAMIMFRRELLDKLPAGQWLPEDPGGCGHSDGVFMERLAAAAGIIPGIDEVLCEHRNTPWSTYSPS
jgi:GT2 family glycosyltransferase